MRLAVGEPGRYVVHGRDREGRTLWSWPGDAEGRTYALSPAPAGGVWAAGERVVGPDVSTGSVDRLDASGSHVAAHLIAFGAAGHPARAWPVALQATADGGVLLAAGVEAEGLGGATSKGALLRRLGPDGGLRWERRWADWEPLALLRSGDEVRLVATRPAGECTHAVRVVVLADPPPACVPSCAA